MFYVAKTGIYLGHIAIEADPVFDTDTEIATGVGVSPSDPIAMRAKNVRGGNLRRQQKDGLLVLGVHTFIFTAQTCVFILIRK